MNAQNKNETEKNEMEKQGMELEEMGQGALRQTALPPAAGLSRRRFMGGAGMLGVAGLLGSRAAHPADAALLAEDVNYGKEYQGPLPSYSSVERPFENGARQLVHGYPGKRPMVRLTTRPPQLETPFSVFDGGTLTPNDAFYVRYHGSQFPVAIDPNVFRLAVSGNVNRALNLTLQQLKANYPVKELVAVCQCSGNSRGYSEPRVKGGQYAHGAMGNARWTGVALKDVLNAAGLKAGSVQVSFAGLDGPSEDAPDFVKALDTAEAMNGDVMLAWAMNGEDLPLLNGYPLRLVVPGWYATYWVKHVNQIRVLTTTLDHFYMTTAYRIPDNACACVPPGTAPAATVPINKLNVRSFITSLEDGAEVRAGGTLTVRGIAFDGGSGIQSVQFSDDGGVFWREAQLGEDLGNYSFRPWSIEFTPRRTGGYQLMARATARDGTSQPTQAQWNPAGYMRNVIEQVAVTAV